MAATIAASNIVPIDDYLRSNYDPDLEYVDGELKERPVVMSVHGRLQALLAHWFLQHEDEWKMIAAVEVRTRVSPTRVRLPDVVVDHARIWPQTLVEAPFLVIEILSPGDSYVETRRKIRDYLAMGIKNVWIIDPETRKAEVCGEHPKADLSYIAVEGTPVCVDLDQIFARLDRYQPGEAAEVPPVP